MKINEKKITGIAILLILTMVAAAGAYLVYRAWDYWSADQVYADMGRHAVQKMRMAGQPDGNIEFMSEKSAERKSEERQADAAAGNRSADEDMNQATEQDCASETVDGIEIPDKPIIDWDELKKSGRDIVAWLDIPALGIAYPVVRGDDNEFYLHHLPNGAYKNAGSLFMETGNSPDLTDINTVIYGHNMDNGSMFGKFRHITEDDYKRQPFLWLCTKERTCLYKMISLHISRVDDESYTLFEIEDCRDDLMSESSRNRDNLMPESIRSRDDLMPESIGSRDSKVTEWILEENRRSYINMPIPKSALSRIITLSTCASYSDERRVLQAILLREYAP